MKKIYFTLSLLLCLALTPVFCMASYTASDWAQTELSKAESLSLIPDSLKNADLTQHITRAEFAAVSVKAFEAITGTPCAANGENPFSDTQDSAVLAAYNLGIVNGVSATEFAPDSLLTREQAATMLSRVVVKQVPVEDIDIAEEELLKPDDPALFADDAFISDWARNSVYFLAQYGIISGVGDNKFAPRNTTPEEEASGYANTTREQALLLAVRLTESIKTVTPAFKATVDEYDAFILRLSDFLTRLSTAEDPEPFMGEYLSIMAEMEAQNEAMETVEDGGETLGDTLYLFNVLVKMIKIMEGF